MKKVVFLLVLLMTSMDFQAQELVGDPFSETIITPRFFITIIAGVILALGFQFILTALSVAAGISSIGDVKKSYVEGKNHSSGKHSFKDEDPEADEHHKSHSTGVMITTGFGIWSTLTVSISLFGATAFALNLTMIANSLIGVTLALVIWASFFIILFYLESKVVNTMIGGLINTATAGLRSSADVVKGMFATSKEKKIKNIADDTIEKIRKEFQNPIDQDTIHETLDEFFEKFDKKVPDYQKIKKDIEKIVRESDKRSEKNKEHSSGSSPAKWMAVQNVISSAIDSSSDGDSAEGKSRTEQLKMLQKEIKEAYSEGDTKEEKAKKVIARLTPAEEQQVQDYMNKIQESLSSEGSESLNENDIKEKVEEILKNPKVEAEKLGDKLGEIDRNYVVTFLSKNTSLNRMEVEKYADKIEKAIRRIQLELSGNNEDSEFQHIKEKVEGLLSNFGSSDSNSTLDFSGLKNMLQAKMHDQKDNFETFRERLKNYDREDIINSVTNHTRIDREDIDKVVDTIEESRNNVLEKIEKIETSARAKLKTMERKAVIQAEHTRKTAASAAWWLVVSAVFSALAAIGGSLLTVIG